MWLDPADIPPPLSGRGHRHQSNGREVGPSVWVNDRRKWASPCSQEFGYDFLVRILQKDGPADIGVHAGPLALETFPALCHADGQVTGGKHLLDRCIQK